MSSAAAKKPRPKYLNLRALLVFPFAAWLLYMLDASLASPASFEKVAGYLKLPLVKAGLLLFIWAYCHHLCAGVRFLLLDLNRGIELAAARRSSGAVLVASLALTAFFGARLW